MPRFAARKQLTDQCDQTLISKHETQKSSLSLTALSSSSAPVVSRGGGGSCGGRLSVKVVIAVFLNHSTNLVLVDGSFESRGLSRGATLGALFSP